MYLVLHICLKCRQGWVQNPENFVDVIYIEQSSTIQRQAVKIHTKMPRVRVQNTDGI